MRGLIRLMHWSRNEIEPDLSESNCPDDYNNIRKRKREVWSCRASPVELLALMNALPMSSFFLLLKGRAFESGKLLKFFPMRVLHLWKVVFILRF